MWLSELKLRGWSDTEFKKKKNLAQDPGAVTRDVIPGFRNTAHSRRLTPGREKRAESQAGRARTAVFNGSQSRRHKEREINAQCVGPYYFWQ